MMFRGYFLAAAMLAMSACSGTTTTPASNGTTATPEPPAPIVKAIPADAMYAAEAAYNVPAHAYITADAKGLLKPAIKAKVKPVLVDAYAELKKVRVAYALVDSAAFDLAYKALQAKATEANKLLP